MTKFIKLIDQLNYEISDVRLAESHFNTLACKKVYTFRTNSNILIIHMLESPFY